MSKRSLIIILVISVAINLAAILTFGYHWWERRSCKREITSRWIDKGRDLRRSLLRQRLNLTEEQMEAINALHEEMRPKMLSLKEKLFTKREKLISLLRETEPNKARADSLIKEIASLQAEAEAQFFENLCQMRDVLTPEQQKQFLQLYERRLHPRGMHLPSLEERPEQGMQDRRRPGREEGGHSGKWH